MFRVFDLAQNKTECLATIEDRSEGSGGNKTMISPFSVQERFNLFEASCGSIEWQL